jgi:hypothetical protein
MDMRDKTKGKVAIVCVVIIFILSGIYLFVPWVGGYNWVGWLLAITNLLAGPLTLIAYLNEVRKGVFKENQEPQTEETPE